MMNSLKTYRSIAVSLVFLLLFAGAAFAQVKVDRSGDRVVIAGTAYYIHTVKKGETVYSVSRAYGISTQDLLRENPAAGEGLKEGQSIRIPERLVDTAQSSVAPETPRQPVNEVQVEAFESRRPRQPQRRRGRFGRMDAVEEAQLVRIEALGTERKARHARRPQRRPLPDRYHRAAACRRRASMRWCGTASSAARRGCRRKPTSIARIAARLRIRPAGASHRTPRRRRSRTTSIKARA